jgi:hypothetical protein
LGRRRQKSSALFRFFWYHDGEDNLTHMDNQNPEDRRQSRDANPQAQTSTSTELNWETIAQEVEAAARHVVELRKLLAMSQKFDQQTAERERDVELDKKIRHFGGTEGLKRELRDWQIYSLERRRAILAHEAGSSVANRADELRAAIETNSGLAAAAAYEDLKQRVRHPGKVPMKPEHRETVKRMLAEGADPTDLTYEYRLALGQAEAQLQTMRADNPTIDEYVIASDDLADLIESKKREDRFRG